MSLRLLLRKQEWPASIVFSGLFVSVVCGCGQQNQDKHMVDVCKEDNKQFEIKIAAFNESGMINPVPNTTYVFQSRNVGDSTWQEITRFISDDEIISPCDTINFVSEKLAYFYMGWKYAVTTDSGNTWSVWDAENDLPGWIRANYKLIKSVTLSLDGKGEMELNPIRYRANKLTTVDFGVNWSAK